MWRTAKVPDQPSPPPQEPKTFEDHVRLLFKELRQKAEALGKMSSAERRVRFMYLAPALTQAVHFAGNETEFRLLLPCLSQIQPKLEPIDGDLDRALIEKFSSLWQEALGRSQEISVSFWDYLLSHLPNSSEARRWAHAYKNAITKGQKHVDKRDLPPSPPAHDREAGESTEDHELRPTG